MNTRIHRYGAIAASDWTDRFHRRMPIPSGCREVLACQVPTLPQRAKAAAERVLKNRPKVRKLIIHYV
jgi:hypothetical protein